MSKKKNNDKVFTAAKIGDDLVTPVKFISPEEFRETIESLPVGLRFMIDAEERARGLKRTMLLDEKERNDG